MKIHDLLHKAEKIYAGIADADTRNDDLKPLWEYPVLLESYLAMLRHPTDDHHFRNFHIIAELVCPRFIQTACAIGALPNRKLSLETASRS